MTSIDTLAQAMRDTYGIDTLDAARAVVQVHVDQIANDSDFWDADTDTLTEDGVELVSDAIAESYKHGVIATAAQQLIDDIADEAAAIKSAEQTIKERTVRRDELIRVALRTELRRADIAAAARVERARLYQIRDGRR